MLCSVNMETEYTCCAALGRKAFACYALIKVIIDALLAGGLSYKVPWLSDFAAAVHICIAAFFVVDIIFQIMLIVAVYKKTEQNLSVYHKYTKVLWWTSLTLGVIYVIYYFDAVPTVIARYFIGLEDIIATFIAIIFVSAIIQRVMWNNLTKSEAGESKWRFFKFNFSVQSGPVNTENEMIEEERIDNDAVEEIIITNEKAKLTE